MVMFMSDALICYQNIMKKYREGAYGEEHLTLSEILKRAGKPDLFDEMSIEDVQYLLDNSSGFLRSFFNSLKMRKLNG